LKVPSDDSDATTATGLRQRKKVATRQALCLAALRLAVERGLESVFVEDPPTALPRLIRLALQELVHGLGVSRHSPRAKSKKNPLARGRPPKRGTR
jgi:hypothetical protein